jgi:hypothetical protein
MNGAKFIVSVGISLGVAVPFGCSSSSTGPGPIPDSGSPPDTSVADTGSGTPCDPFRAELCPQGQTCCYTGLRGLCTDVGACASPFQIGCVNTPTCSSGVCCGSVQLPVGFDASASLDASFDASGFGLTLACVSSCPAPDFEVCLSSDECPSGEICAGGPMGIDGYMSPLTACFQLDAGAEAAPPRPDGGDAGPGGEGGTPGDGGASADAAADGG